MILLEFAAQGIRGVAPAGGRATLRPGYNVIAAEGATLRRLVESLLYPGEQDGEDLPRAAGGPANAPMRAGLTLLGDDRNTYRLVRDFATGCQLHRFDPVKRSFALVSQDLSQIGDFLRRTVGVPAPARLSALLALSVSDLPSRQGGASAAAALPPQRQSLTPDQARKRIDALRGELQRAKIAEKLQYQLDGLQAQLFKQEEALKAGQKIREGLATAEEARAELEPAARVAARLGDADATLAAFEKATARRGEAAAKVAAERENLAAVETRGAPRPPWLDPLFWAGAGGGIVIAVAAAIGSRSIPDLRYLSLLDIPAFGWAAWVALRWVSALEDWERLGRKRQAIDGWEKKVESQLGKEVADVKEAASALGVANVAELKDAIARVADADAVVSEWRKRLADWEALPASRNAMSERARVQAALDGIEQKLTAEAGGFVRDVASVEAEIRRLETEASSPAPAARAPSPPPPPARAAGDPLRTLLERAAAELGGSPAAAGRSVAKRASQALVGLSFQRLQAVVVDDRGNVQVQTGGRSVSAATLPSADRDVVWLALKLAFLEQALASAKLVGIAEDAFGGLSEGSRRFAARLLKQIAKPAQILHATSDPSFREAADHAA